MNKKLIFIGPPGSGKTTIRKVFFEGENSSELLKYALEPTFGQESLIFKMFDEEIGLFDLAGQENKRWLESEDKKIFFNANIIIIVIEAPTDIKEIVRFTNRLVDIREELAPKSKLYLFLHKIDLFDEIKIQILKRQLKDHKKNLNLTKIFFTSIKSQYLIQTFSYLIEIIKSNLEGQISRNLIDSKFLNEVIRLLYYLNKEVVMTEKDIQLKLNVSQKNTKKLIIHLLEKGHIEFTKAQGNRIYTLTEKGKAHFEYITNSFNLDNFYEFENDIFIPEFPTKKEIPLFIGFFISDENGRTILIIELYKGVLNEYLSEPKLQEFQKRSMNIELIPMFISALQKFSKEINIKSLSGFILKGINLKMQIIIFGKYTVTFFINPNIYLKPIEYKIKNYFLELFDDYEVQLEHFKDSGSLLKDTEIKEKCLKWMKKMNQEYRDLIMKLESYDHRQGKILYNNLDHLQDQLNIEISVLTEKIKTLKVNLLKAILNKDSIQIKKISEKVQDIRLKFLS